MTTLVCPHCDTEIELTQSLAAPMIAAAEKKFQKQLDAKNALLKQQQEEAKQATAAMDERIEAEVLKAREALLEEATRKARATTAREIELRNTEVSELQELLESRDAKLAEAQKAQAETLRKQRELDDAKREMQLTIDKTVNEGLAKARASALAEAEDRLQLDVREREETITSMQAQIEELRRKAAQGSQQLQGEVQELQLEELLRERFPYDTIEPVPKGVHGGDVLQKVVSVNTQRDCGSILWESKRTKTWSAAWLAKLRDDQRAAKADIAVIVTQTMPKGVDLFDRIDGVWVCRPKAALAVAVVLNQSLIDLSSAQLSNEGMQTKAEEVYRYLTGPQFKARVGAIVEAFNTMRSDLDKERRAIAKQWSKREAQIERVMTATVGMHGDLQGIAGQSVQEVDGIDLKMLEDG